MGQCISHTFRSTYKNSKEKNSSNNFFRILGSFSIFLRANILNFDKLIFRRICLMMFKHYIDHVPKPISDLFQTNDNYHSYSTRNSQALRTPIAIYQTFTYIGSLAWNYISSKIPTDVSYICFKSIAKLYCIVYMFISDSRSI